MPMIVVARISRRKMFVKLIVWVRLMFSARNLSMMALRIVEERA